MRVLQGEKDLDSWVVSSVGCCGSGRGLRGSLPRMSNGLKGRKLGVRVKQKSGVGQAEVPACSIFDLGLSSCIGAKVRLWMKTETSVLATLYCHFPS